MAEDNMLGQNAAVCKMQRDAENAAAKMALRSLEECENSTLQWCNENARIC